MSDDDFRGTGPHLQSPVCDLRMTASVQSSSGPSHPTDSLSWFPRRKSDGPVRRFLLVSEAVLGQSSKLTCRQYLPPFGPAVFRLHNQRPKDEREREREKERTVFSGGFFWVRNVVCLRKKKKNMAVSSLRKKGCQRRTDGHIRTTEEVTGRFRKSRN